MAVLGTVSSEGETASDPGRVLGVPGETGATLGCGTVVLGGIGLNTGGGGGGTGFTVCAWACSIAPPTPINHPVRKNVASAMRSNFVLCIAVSRGDFPLSLWTGQISQALSLLIEHAGLRSSIGQGPGELPAAARRIGERWSA